MDHLTKIAIAHESTDLSLEKLLEVAKGFKREHFLYVVVSDFIPDDAHGILFVRKEDAEKWNVKKV